MARTSLPPGFRFHPTDIELIMYYLKRKILGKKLHFEAISELNIYKFSPWDLPDKSCLKSKDLEWYFFCPRERKYASGDRMKRGTETGYWKTTGKDRSIMYDGRVVGTVKTLVFHEGNAPHGKRTDWLIYEYRMDDKKLADDGVAQDGYVLYKVFKKNGPGPKNGAQYGAPFVEEEWDNDDSVIAIDSFPGNGSSSLVIMGSENQNSTASKSLIKPVCTSGLSIVGSGPAVQISPEEALVDGLTHSMVTDMFGPPVLAGCAMNGQGLSSARSSSNDVSPMPNDDIAYLLDAFTEDPSFPNEQGHYELGESSHSKDNIALPHLHGNDPFNGLEDLGTWAEVSGGVNFSHDQGHNMNNVLGQDDETAYLELNDLDTPLNSSVESGGFQNVPTSTYAACNPNTSQHLSGSAQQNFSANSGQICSDVNFPISETVFPRLSQCSMLPNSSGRPEGSTNVFPTGNTYQNIFSQGYTAGYNLHSFSYRQAEEFVDAANYQERGVPQRKNLSRLQQMLGSFTTVVHDPASVAHAPSNSAYGGSSSIHVKAEVISTLSQCTKDALSVMLEESTYDYSCWWNLHGAEFWKKATADCSNGYGCVLFTWTNVGVIPPFFITTTFAAIMNMMILVLLLGETFFHEMLTNFFLFLSFSKFRFRSSSFPSFIFLHVVLTSITVLK